MWLANDFPHPILGVPEIASKTSQLQLRTRSVTDFLQLQLAQLPPGSILRPPPLLADSSGEKQEPKPCSSSPKSGLLWRGAAHDIACES